MASPKLLRRIKSAANASKSFSLACQRALDNPQPDIDASFSQSQWQSQHPSQPSQQEILDLTEQELRAWREATEPLGHLLPENTRYFAPYSVIPQDAEDGPLPAQINAINLALILEMFLPISTREKYPNLTMKIPYIDTPEIVPSSQSLSHLSMGSQSSFGLSQASQQLSKEEQISRLTEPLADLKVVYLHLCAGRKEKHVLYVLRRILLEISCISIITSTKARGLSTFKPQDLVDTFSSAFLRDSAFVGEGKVFETKELQEKACRLWEKWAGDLAQRFKSSVTSTKGFMWECLSETLLTDLFRHVLPPVLEDLEESEAKARTNAPVPSKGVAASGTGIPKDGIQAHKPTTDKSVHAKVSKKPAQDMAINLAPPMRISKSKEVVAGKPSAVSALPLPSVSKPSNVTASSESAPAFTDPVMTPIFSLATTIDEDEFGPRIPNPANKAQVGLPERERTVTRAFGGEEVDLMEYMQDFGDDGPQDFGDVFDFGDAGGNGEALVAEETQFEDLVARFGEAPYVEAPKQGYTRVPQNFRFNAPQANATKVTMTPSPESQAKGPSYLAPAATGSTLSRMKSAVVTDRAKTKTVSQTTSAVAEDVRPAKAKNRKRKQAENGEDASIEDPTLPRTKKRKVTDKMPPPTHPTKSTETTTVDSSTAAKDSHAARHSSTSSKALFNPSEMASSSRAVNRDLPAAPKATKRFNIVLADTDSSDDEPIIRTKTTKSSALPKATEQSKPTAKKTATPATKPTAKIPRAEPLPVGDAVMSAAKTRLEQIKAIDKENKRLQAELGPDEDDDTERPAKKDEDSEATEVDSEDEEELRKYRASQTSGNGTKALETSLKKLADIKKRADAVASLPRRTRQKHNVPDPLSDDESEAAATDEDTKPKAKKRGRPRKQTKKGEDSDASSRAAASARGKGKRPNQYKTNANEVGRKRWSDEENKVFLFALEANYYRKDANHTLPWAAIQKLHGKDGTECQTLANRNVVQMKDRARNIALRIVNDSKKLPEFLTFITLPKSRIRV